MKTTGQHEFHPDAESLNAFAEQALGERERGHVLEHLALCGRCRQVVALAQEAAAEVVAPAAARRVAVRARAWWRGWGLALAPAAALAATAVVAIYLHERNVERAEMARFAEQIATQNVAKPSQPERAEAAPPAPSAAAKSLTKALRPERSGAAQGAPERGPVVAAATPPAEAMNGLVSVHEGSAQGSGAENGALDRNLEAPAEQPARASAAPTVAAFEEQKKRIEAEAVERHMFAAKATAPASEQGANGGAQASSSAQVVVTAAAPQLETRTAPAVSFGALERPQAGGLFAARMVSSIHLPSGLPAVSMASAGQRMLAIDHAGTLFLSEDSGGTWEPVTRQWTGRAVMVRRQTEGAGNPEAAPAAEAETAGNTSAGTGAALRSPAVFEILNDQRKVWLSTDGKIWIAK